MIFIGDDWAEDHHDVYLMDEAGARLASRRLPEGLAGIGEFHQLLARHADDPGQVVLGIETDRGLWVTALVVAGYQVYAINPMAAARYRDRHHVSGAKSDAADAKLLADLVRTDRHNHRKVAGDSADAEAVKVLARAHQNLIWTRNRHTNALRSALREYYPGALKAFDDLHDRDALAILGRAPTPVQAASLSLSKIRSALKVLGDNATSMPELKKSRPRCAPNSSPLPPPSPLHSRPAPAPPSPSSPN
jgi:transposase